MDLHQSGDSLHQAFAAAQKTFSEFDHWFSNLLATHSVKAAHIIYVILIAALLFWLWKKCTDTFTSYPEANELVQKYTTPTVNKSTNIPKFIITIVVILIVLFLLALFYQRVHS